MIWFTLQQFKRNNFWTKGLWKMFLSIPSLPLLSILKGNVFVSLQELIKDKLEIQYIIEMPRRFQKYLEGYNLYRCRKCYSHFASLSDLISTSYVGASGKAYLMNKVINVIHHKEITEEMNSGKYQISRISCSNCANTLDSSTTDSSSMIGWIYVKSHNHDNKFKEGKFILEVKFIQKQNWVEKTEE